MIFGEVFEKIAGLHNKIGQLLSKPLQDGSSGAGSVLSKGNVLIIIAVAAVVIVGVITLVIVKKKHAPSGGDDEKDE